MDKPSIYAIAAVVCLGLTLCTNQVFHGGVWGDLPNKSVRPVVELSEATLHDGALSVQLYRVEGADVYGSFAIGRRIKDEADQVMAEWTAEQLSQLAVEDIHSHYVARVTPGAHSLIIPLGAKADVRFRSTQLEDLQPCSLALTKSSLSISAVLSGTLR